MSSFRPGKAVTCVCGCQGRRGDCLYAVKDLPPPVAGRLITRSWFVILLICENWLRLVICSCASARTLTTKGPKDAKSDGLRPAHVRLFGFVSQKSLLGHDHHLGDTSIVGHGMAQRVPGAFHAPWRAVLADHIGRVAQMRLPAVAALLRSAGHSFSQSIRRLAQASLHQDPAVLDLGTTPHRFNVRPIASLFTHGILPCLRGLVLRGAMTPLAKLGT
jgi:hypothetical protein